MGTLSPLLILLCPFRRILGVGGACECVSVTGLVNVRSPVYSLVSSLAFQVALLSTHITALTSTLVLSSNLQNWMQWEGHWRLWAPALFITWSKMIPGTSSEPQSPCCKMSHKHDKVHQEHKQYYYFPKFFSPATLQLLLILWHLSFRNTSHRSFCSYDTILKPVF